MIKPAILILLFTNWFVHVAGQEYQQRLDSCSLRFVKEVPGDSSFVDAIIARNACMIGAAIPKFSAVSLDNIRFDSSVFAGKVTVLHFWSTTCGPCIEEIPGLNEIVTYYKDKDIVFLSFAPEHPVKLRPFLKKYPFRFPVVPHGLSISFDLFKLTNFLPYTIIIDKKGRIAQMWFGSFGVETFSTFKEQIDLASTL